MGNNFCSICNNQTSIIEINQFSFNLVNNNNNKIKNEKRNMLDSSFISNISISSINSISLNRETNNSKQSLYEFNNLIYLIDKKTKNILIEHINKKSKIKEEIKNLFFISSFKDYNLHKKNGVYSIKDINFDDFGIPKEIYEGKGLNYIKRKNYIEVLFIKEMKMVKIFNDNNNINIIHNINNFNNIESFSKQVNKSNISNIFFLNKKGNDSKENSLTNYSSIIKKEKKDNFRFSSSKLNRNSVIIDKFNSVSLVNITEENGKNYLSSAKLIFHTLLLIAEEESNIIYLLKSKIDIKNIYEYYLINNTWLDKYKSIFNYNVIYNYYKEKFKKKELKKSDIINIIKRQPKILENIINKLNNKDFLYEFKDIKNLIHFEYHKSVKYNFKLKEISIPYNFNLINKKTLDLIIKQFNFKCLNSYKDKEEKAGECTCEFCENNFLKKYICYIGNETIFINNKDIDNNESHFFACTINMKNFSNNIIIKNKYLTLYDNNINLFNEINNYMNKGSRLKDYFIIKNLEKNIILQDIVDTNKKIVIGKIINIKLLLKQKEELEIISYKKRSTKTFINLEVSNLSTAFSTRKKTSKKVLNKFQPLLSYKKPSLIGLNRNGQPLFFNPILQCLSNIQELTNFFLFKYDFFQEENKKIKYPLSYYYSNLIKELWKKPSEEDSEINNYPYYKKSFLPFQIKEYIFKVNKSILFQQKNMFRELFLFIIGQLDKELYNYENEINNININDNIINISSQSSSSEDISSCEDEEKLLNHFRDEYYKKFNSIIQKNFYSEIQVSYQCLDCNLFKYHYELVNSFTFDLEKIKSNIMLKYKFRDIMKKILILNLSDCFENQEKPSILEENIFCQKCKLKTLQKQIRIIKSPNILVLFFKEKEISKIEFDISIDLQLNPFIHDKIYNNEKDSKNDNLCKRNSYDLICILTGPREKAKKGIYLAYCKNPVNNLWYCYNDSIVTSVDIQVLRDIKIPKLLIYRRKEVICLFFEINDEKRFDIEANMDMVFRNVISYLYVKYSWLKNLNISSFIYNGKDIDINKTISQNNLSNGSIIFCKRDLFLNI